MKRIITVVILGILLSISLASCKGNEKLVHVTWTEREIVIFQDEVPQTIDLEVKIDDQTFYTSVSLEAEETKNVTIEEIAPGFVNEKSTIENVEIVEIKDTNSSNAIVIALCFLLIIVLVLIIRSLLA